MASQSRRRHSPDRRSCRVAITFTPRELTRVQEAAQRNGMAVAAWIGTGAVDRADGRSGDGRETGRISPDALAVLMELSRQLGWAGNLLNQAVRGLNATGQRPGRLAAYAARCMDVIDNADEAIEELRLPRRM